MSTRGDHAYWYLRAGYVFVARDYVPREANGEIDRGRPGALALWKSDATAHRIELALPERVSPKRSRMWCD